MRNLIFSVMVASVHSTELVKYIKLMARLSFNQKFTLITRGGLFIEF